MIYYIEEGLENDLFMIYFQPQYNLITGELIGAEALARLKEKKVKYFHLLLYQLQNVQIKYTNLNNGL